MPLHFNEINNISSLANLSNLNNLVLISLSKNNIHNIPSNIKLLLSKVTIVNIENQIISEEEFTTSAKLSLSSKVSVFENKITRSEAVATLGRVH